MTINLIKLCVGVDTIAELSAWQNKRLREGGEIYHVTRMMPKRADELINGGSIYWIIRGMVSVRQRIVDLKRITSADGIQRCKIVFDAQLVPVRPSPRRPFQGWRYLSLEDAPDDLKHRAGDDELPPKLQADLAELGLL